MNMEERNINSLSNGVLSYGNKVARRQRIKSVIGATISATGMVGVGLYVRGATSSVVLGLVSAGLVMAGAGMGIYYNAKVNQTKDAMDRLAREKTIDTNYYNESYDFMMYR